MKRDKSTSHTPYEPYLLHSLSRRINFDGWGQIQLNEILPNSTKKSHNFDPSSGFRKKKTILRPIIKLSKGIIFNKKR